MGIRLATATIKAIDDAIKADQGAAFRGYLRSLLPQFEDIYRTEDDGPRSHLGASVIGKECAREVWFGHRWYARESHPGRIVRLFNRGHMEEPRFLAALMCAGVTPYFVDESGNQFKFKNLDGHFAGSLDSVLVGLPELGTEPALGEFKTHGEKSFVQLQKYGLRESKITHYVQMQIYMQEFNLRFGLYLAVNKNTDELYGEIIEFDEVTAARYTDRARGVLGSTRPPRGISQSPSWYGCKMCSFSKVCHTKTPAAKSCRSCTHVLLTPHGGWACNLRGGAALSKEEQIRACENYAEIEK
ncbi:putative exonuclease [Microcystis phage Me-ZS1]|nr:putative exonuclease [Microcystis phage Me-ZS1]